MVKKVTLQDVADLANVAIGTASQALNSKKGVQPATRERVINAARELGYDHRFVLSEETHTEIKTIGVVKHESYDRPGLDPFYYPVISGIEQECQKCGFSMVFSTGEVNDRFRMTRMPSSLAKNRLDGLIVVGFALNDEFTAMMQKFECPVVLVDGYSAGEVFDSVRMSNIEGAYHAVSYLIQNGHQHIGLIGSTPGAYPSLMERREGYLNALRDHDIPSAYIEDGLIYRDSASVASEELLRKYPHLTAIYVCNDNASIGVMNSVRKLGLSVPGDISVVGFDDIAFAQDMVPPLTTMRVDKLMLGRLAVRQLVVRAENPEAPVVTIQLKTELIVRESVRMVGKPRS